MLSIDKDNKIEAIAVLNYAKTLESVIYHAMCYDVENEMYDGNLIEFSGINLAVHFFSLGEAFLNYIEIYGEGADFKIKDPILLHGDDIAVNIKSNDDVKMFKEPLLILIEKLKETKVFKKNIKNIRDYIEYVGNVRGYLNLPMS